jgi:hypothetical protein
MVGWSHRPRRKIELRPILAPQSRRHPVGCSDPPSAQSCEAALRIPPPSSHPLAGCNPPSNLTLLPTAFAEFERRRSRLVTARRLPARGLRPPPHPRHFRLLCGNLQGDLDFAEMARRHNRAKRHFTGLRGWRSGEALGLPWREVLDCELGVGELGADADTPAMQEEVSAGAG